LLKSPAIISFVADCDGKPLLDADLWNSCLASGYRIFNLRRRTNRKRHS